MKSSFIIFVSIIYYSFQIAQAFQVQTTSILNRHHGERYRARQSRYVVGLMSQQLFSNTEENKENEIQNKTDKHKLSDQQRRKCLRSIIAFTAATSSSSLSSPMVVQNANAAQTTGEAIRRSAANLPGYGQADIFYPNLFIGKWKATRVIVSLPSSGSEVYFPLTATSCYSLIQEMLPLTITYDVRFVTVDGDMKNLGNDNYNDNGKVIADRQFNEESLYNALRNAIMTKMNDSIALQQPPSIQTISWSPSNPNVLTSNYNDGSSKEIKVTKRAAELDLSNGLVSSSEYRRITTVSGSGLGGGSSGTSSSSIIPGIPSISASRVLNKWKISSSNSENNSGNSMLIEGIEIVYADGIVGDPMASGRQQQQQQSTSKSRLRLQRL